MYLSFFIHIPVFRIAFKIPMEEVAVKNVVVPILFQSSS
jgi:hypothetical protein